MGFSLIELLIAMIICSILSVIGIDSWQQTKLRNELATTTQQLIHFLNEVRVDANLYNINHTIHLFFDHPSRWCIAVTETSRPDRCDTRFQFKLKTHSVDISILTENRFTLAFYGRRSMAQAGTIRLQNSIGESRIIISTYGRIRYCAYEIDLTGFPSC